MGSGKLLVFRAVAVTFGVGLVLGMGEGVLRALRPLDLSTSHKHRIPHPERGWALEPGASYLNQIGSIRVPVSYSRDGWRDVEHRVPKPPGETRIVVLGDSFMEGYSVRLEELMAKRLEGELRARGTDAQVVNLGVGGYGTLQELITFETVGVRHEPSVVLLGFYENDLQNNLRELELAAAGAGNVKVESRPFLLEEREGSLEEGDGFAVSEIDHVAARRRFEANRLAEETALCARVKRNSALAQQLDRAGQRLVRILSAARAIVRAGWRRALGLFSADAEQSRLVLRQARASRCRELHDRAWTVTARLLERLDAEVTSSGARLVVFSVPSLNGVAHASVDQSPSRTVGDCAGGSEPSRLADIAERLDLDFVDLFPAFHARAAEDPERLFHAADQHWNAAGHALAATVLAEAIVEAGARTTSGVGTKPTPPGPSRAE